MTYSEISKIPIEMPPLRAGTAMYCLRPDLPTFLVRIPVHSLSHRQRAWLSLQKSVISWLLNHDPAKRPTAMELLKSELLPPPQMEESELHEVLHHTLANVDGKAYRTMMAQIFSQRISPAIDYTYDSDILKVGSGHISQRELNPGHWGVKSAPYFSGILLVAPL